MVSLLPPLLALIAGILVSPWLDSLSVWAVLPLAFLVSVRHRRMTLAAIGLLGSGLRSLEPPVPAIYTDAPVRLVGVLTKPPEWRGLGAYLDVRVQSVDAQPSYGRARLTEFLDNPDLRQLFDELQLGSGDRLEIVLKLHRPVVYRNPGVFDFRHHLERQQIYWTGNVRNPRLITILERGSPGQKLLDRIQHWFETRLSEPFKDDQLAGSLVLAMVLGRKYGLTADTERKFQAGGLYHLLVVSGFNLGVIAATALWIGRYITRRRTTRLLMVLGSALVYGAIVELGQPGQAPVWRAALMVCFLVIGRIFDRGYSALNAPAGSAFVILAIDPMSLEDSSFQMTFGAILAVVGIGVPATQWAFGWLREALTDLNNTDLDGNLPIEIADWRVSWRLWCEYRHLPFWTVTAYWRAWKFLGEAAIVSICVEMVFLIFMVESFHRVTPISPLLNIPAGMIAAIVTPLSLLLIVLPPFACATIAGIIQELLALLSKLIDIALQLPGATLRVPSVPTALWITYALVIGLTVFALHRRRRMLLIPALCIVGMLQIVIVLRDFSPPSPADATLTFLDVGQGDSILVELPSGPRILIDGGGVASGRFLDLRDESTFSIGEDVVSPYLFSRKLRHLDAVVLTHAHNDHLDGLFDVVENFDIGEFWLGRNPMTPPYHRLIERLQEKQIPIRWLSAGQRLGPFTVLHPPADWKPRKAAQNDDSVVLLLETNGRTALFTGDIERKIEAPETVDVLKVAHHGSRGVRLATRGTVRVISVGANNPFGHPHPSTLPALRTDQLGAITVTLTKSCRECKLPLLFNGH
jgi:competence protein ComEC